MRPGRASVGLWAPVVRPLRHLVLASPDLSAEIPNRVGGLMPSKSFLRCILAGSLLILVPVASADPRPPAALDASQMRLALQRLQVAGSALYVAAHPDDENTSVITWLVQGRKVRTGYLSMTRGDGGQNLIGSELGDGLGVIRTQELLAARRVDGGEQLFTRAVDFGFSKNSEETMEMWGHEALLSDVVWAIRRFRPDVLITRFPPDSNAGHGHHSASAQLAEEAFLAAADPKRFPEQLAHVKPWQAKRLVWNAFVRGSTVLDPSWLRIDVGAYDPLLGRSFSEFAGVSRSFHKSQGFGAPERRGVLPNYFAHKLGEAASADLFDGVDLTWRRFPGGERVQAALAEAEKRYDPTRPQAILPFLAKAHTALASLPAGDPLVEARCAELEHVMASCAGLWVEAIALHGTAIPGSPLRVMTSVLQRVETPVVVESVELAGKKIPAARTLSPGLALNDTLQIRVPVDQAPSQPYWLARPYRGGRFDVEPPLSIGLAENPAALTARIRVRLGEVSFTIERGVAFRWVDPVLGERWRALDVAPPATLALDEEAYLFPDRAARNVAVTVTAQRAGVSGTLGLSLPEGWTSVPATVPVSIAKEAGESRFVFQVTPAASASASRIVAAIEVDGRSWSHSRVTIDHPHIPRQTLFPPADAPAVRTDLVRRGERIGYVMGSGDVGPMALRQMGYQVTLLSDADLESADLSRFDAIVTGVRALNTRSRLRALQPRLLDYAEQGGTLVVQYVTTSDGPVENLGPFPFRVSRDRVTVEAAPVRFARPGHALLSGPNVLGAADFEGWVQERGLYFANPWDPRYDAVLSSNDPHEPARDGGLLYARHGKGQFIYCGYALFRQLPAGVPGAWRLFANLVSPRP